MQITNEWTEVTLSTVNTYTTVQNISGAIVLLALADATPDADETANARKVDFFEQGKKNDDTWTYNHETDTKKLYVRGIYLADGIIGNVSVY